MYECPGWGETYPTIQLTTVGELVGGKQKKCPPKKGTRKSHARRLPRPGARKPRTLTRLRVATCLRIGPLTPLLPTRTFEDNPFVCANPRCMPRSKRVSGGKGWPETGTPPARSGKRADSVGRRPESDQESAPPARRRPPREFAPECGNLGFVFAVVVLIMLSFA